MPPVLTASSSWKVDAEHKRPGLELEDTLWAASLLPVCPLQHAGRGRATCTINKRAAHVVHLIV